jgi:hypothetical protein
MQTLTRPSYAKQRRPATSPGISTGIPAPFPRGEFLRMQETQAEASARQAEPQAGPSFVPESEGSVQETTKTSLLVSHLEPPKMIVDSMEYSTTSLHRSLMSKGPVS